MKCQIRTMKYGKGISIRPTKNCNTRLSKFYKRWTGERGAAEPPAFRAGDNVFATRKEASGNSERGSRKLGKKRTEWQEKREVERRV